MTDDMTGGQLTILITSVVGFLGTFFGFWGQWIVARRNRAQELEDRQLAAQELVDMAEAKAKAVVIEAKALADAVAIKALQSVRQLERSIEKVGTDAVGAARQAYQEANHVNLKIEKLTERLVVAEDAKTDETDKKLDQVIATGDSIEGKVDKLGATGGS